MLSRRLINFFFKEQAHWVGGGRGLILTRWSWCIKEWIIVSNHHNRYAQTFTNLICNQSSILNINLDIYISLRTLTYAWCRISSSYTRNSYFPSRSWGSRWAYFSLGSPVSWHASIPRLPWVSTLTWSAVCTVISCASLQTIRTSRSRLSLLSREPL